MACSGWTDAKGLEAIHEDEHFVVTFLFFVNLVNLIGELFHGFWVCWCFRKAFLNMILVRLNIRRFVR